MDFHEILYLSSFRKSADKIKASLKSDNNNGYFTWIPLYNFDYISLIPSWNEKYFRQSCRENHNILFVFNSFFFVNRAFYEIMCKNIVQMGRLQITTWRTHIACWVPKSTNTKTHTGCVILIALPLQQWLQERRITDKSYALPVLLHCVVLSNYSISAAYGLLWVGQLPSQTFRYQYNRPCCAG